MHRRSLKFVIAVTAASLALPAVGEAADDATLVFAAASLKNALDCGGR